MVKKKPTPAQEERRTKARKEKMKKVRKTFNQGKSSGGNKKVS